MQTTVITDGAHGGNVPVVQATRGNASFAPTRATGLFGRFTSGPSKFLQRTTYAIVGSSILTSLVMFLFAFTAVVLGVIGFSLLANVVNTGPALSLLQFTHYYIALYVFSTLAAIVQLFLPCLLTGLSIHQSTLPFLTGLFILNLGIFALQLATLIIASEQRLATFLLLGLDGRVYHGLNLMIASAVFSTVTAFLTTIILASNMVHYASLIISKSATVQQYEMAPAKTYVVAQQPALA